MRRLVNAMTALVFVLACAGCTNNGSSVDDHEDQKRPGTAQDGAIAVSTARAYVEHADHGAPETACSFLSDDARKAVANDARTQQLIGPKGGCVAAIKAFQNVGHTLGPITEYVVVEATAKEATLVLVGDHNNAFTATIELADQVWTITNFAPIKDWEAPTVESR